MDSELGGRKGRGRQGKALLKADKRRRVGGKAPAVHAAAAGNKDEEEKGKD